VQYGTIRLPIHHEIVYQDMVAARVLFHPATYTHHKVLPLIQNGPRTEDVVVDIVRDESFIK
jgi:hypothetical protein